MAARVSAPPGAPARSVRARRRLRQPRRRARNAALHGPAPLLGIREGSPALRGWCADRAGARQRTARTRPLDRQRLVRPERIAAPVRVRRRQRVLVAPVAERDRAVRLLRPEPARARRTPLRDVVREPRSVELRADGARARRDDLPGYGAVPLFVRGPGRTVLGARGAR